MVFLKEFFEKVDVEKKSADDKTCKTTQYAEIFNLLIFSAKNDFQQTRSEGLIDKITSYHFLKWHCLTLTKMRECFSLERMKKQL